jgi:biotin carboxyl carrier protein
MGGLFRAPQPVEIAAPPSEPQQQQTVAQAQAQATAAAEAATTEARAASVVRARRGLGGTIATGARGVLAPLPGIAARKTLLGE